MKNNFAYAFLFSITYCRLKLCYTFFNYVWTTQNKNKEQFLWATRILVYICLSNERNKEGAREGESERRSKHFLQKNI